MTDLGPRDPFLREALDDAAAFDAAGLTFDAGTRTFTVRRDGEALGQVRWSRTQRAYVFYPRGGSPCDAFTLRAIAAFIDTQHIEQEETSL